MHSIFTTSNTSYVLMDIFMQFVAVKAKIWWNNKGSSFLWNTVYNEYRERTCACQFYVSCCVCSTSHQSVALRSLTSQTTLELWCLLTTVRMSRCAIVQCGAKKTAPFYFCSNFAKSFSVWIIIGTHIPW